MESPGDGLYPSWWPSAEYRAGEMRRVGGGEAGTERGVTGDYWIKGKIPSHRIPKELEERWDFLRHIG